jgi:prolyl oligopeptidase
MLKYPEVRRGDQVDDYHGTKVIDPYRWLEDVDSQETKKWVEAENKVTFGYLEKIPQRKAIENRLTELWNFERFGLPEKRGGKYFYTRNDGLQNQSVLYVADALDAEPRMLIDPNTLSADGTVALTEWEVSDDGRYVAYGLASAGSDWRDWFVLDVATGDKLPDLVKWVKFSRASWTPDNSGFFYSRYDEPKTEEQFTATNYYHKLYFHRLGDPQEKDQLIYERSDNKDWGFDGLVTEDGHYLIISVWRGTEQKNQIFYKDMKEHAKI